MTLPSGLPYRVLLGLWHKRKQLARNRARAWVEVIAEFLPGVKTRM